MPVASVASSSSSLSEGSSSILSGKYFPTRAVHLPLSSSRRLRARACGERTPTARDFFRITPIRPLTAAAPLPAAAMVGGGGGGGGGGRGRAPAGGRFGVALQARRL